MPLAREAQMRARPFAVTEEASLGIWVPHDSKTRAKVMSLVNQGSLLNVLSLAD